MQKYYLKDNVFEAARKRIRWLFEEFPVVMVNCSGGKDSTVVLNLALDVASEIGRLPVPVLFVDQEAEWDGTIRYMRQVMADTRVEPYWFQGSFQLFSMASSSERWLTCWEDGKEWIRDKEPNSIHENRLGVDRFYDIFDTFGAVYFPGQRWCQITGVRAEESPSRLLSCVSRETYKGVTWGKAISEKHGWYTFHPLYDWDFRDIWAAIAQNDWEYCSLYDALYQYGLPLREMRISSLIHEQSALHWLPLAHEIESETWERITARLADLNAVTQAKALYDVPQELPFMFASWREYREYLLDHLISEESIRNEFRKQFASWDRQFVDTDPNFTTKVQRFCITAILTNDYHLSKFHQFNLRNAYHRRSWKRAHRQEVLHGEA